MFGGSPIPYTMVPFDPYSPYAAPAVRPSAPPRPAPAPVRPTVVARVEVPPPGAIGVVIQDPPVTVPRPADIGIKLDRP